MFVFLLTIQVEEYTLTCSYLCMPSAILLSRSSLNYIFFLLQSTAFSTFLCLCQLYHNSVMFQRTREVPALNRPKHDSLWLTDRRTTRLTDEWTDWQTDGWTDDKQTDRWTHCQTDGWTDDRQTDRWTDWQTDGWTDDRRIDGRTVRRTDKPTERRTDWPTERRTDGTTDTQMDRLTDGQMGRLTLRKIDRPTGRLMDRPTDGCIGWRTTDGSTDRRLRRMLMQVIVKWSDSCRN